MKLLFDQNISQKLVRELKDVYPRLNHVYLLGMHTAADEEVWNYARTKDFIIVTHDSDFYERSLLYGFPPKVIWLRTGNTSTQNIKRLLLKHRESIQLFSKDKTIGCLVVY